MQATHNSSNSANPSSRMTSSTAPCHIIDDDDDEFDWEAAVREIDVAFQNTKPSTSVSASCSSMFAPSIHGSVSDIPITLDTKKTFPKVSRQSTLNNFVAKKGPVPPPPPPPTTTPVGHEAEDLDFHEDEESLGSTFIDAETAKTWIYPVNVPLRDYQLAITKSALFSNTLVALPTGLGKTLVAAVVMYNYFRWFPNGKIVFAAPSRPLVMQQIKACHNIVGIPQKWTIDMTGQLNRKNRAIYWKTKRVFFVTPQVLENDIHSGACLAKYLVCLVIDEAHRAMGNYSYCVAVRELMTIPVQLRILALTATPGSKQQTIQQVIDNLKISVLEYRSESDPDVIPYVHDRKLELVQVAMGQEAVEIDNKILQVIRPLTTRLSAFGVLQNRDYNTLSPCELLKIRVKFREAPPPDLPLVKCGEVEGYFGVLITLYYIRKILSSHGIRPAYEMLEDKLRKGAFARFMSKNGDIWNAKLLMQQSLRQGASSPKLSKMSEVLLKHFKNKDPKSSRVIIFSNYRESVRDIMDALQDLGESIRAAQFIGQSSGKATKGQSQKTQQAVLEKFRSGGYNTIVATSIGEEGLDIMEVDLVICFDANISPLRMIQRMGRTGRKHDGRVVLACEGPELKGYLRKEVKSKAIRKHMRNGGTNSFNFHLSPRMIPHFFKPDVQFVEMRIEQFIPRGKQVQKDHDFELPALEDKLSVVETNVIEKYFDTASGNARKPSLIAFPYYQTFPSRVHTVPHSNRTMMLIDAMQILQRPLLSGDLKAASLEVEKQLDTGSGVDMVDIVQSRKDPDIDGKELEYQFALTRTLRAGDEQCKAGNDCLSLPAHSFLFGADFVSIDDNGKVLISTAPLLKLNEKLHSRETRGSCGVSPLERIMLSKNAGQERHSTAKCIMSCTPLSFELHNLGEQKEKTCEGENVPSSPVMSGIESIEGDIASEMPDPLRNKALDVYTDNMKDSEISPRLTNFLRIGVVPESPDDRGQSRTSFHIPDCASPVHGRDNITGKSTSHGDHKEIFSEDELSQDNVYASINNESETPLLVKNCANIRRRILISPSTEEGHTLLVNATDHSFSEDSYIRSREEDDSVKPMRKFKRLCKAGSCGNKTNQRGKRDIFVSTRNISISCASSNATRNKRGRGKAKPSKDVMVRDFIEEEAEVSSDTDLSDDEDGEDEKNSCDSFIDDRINPTSVSSQSEPRMDMMNVYRRSLLSQSPMERLGSSTIPGLASMSKISENGSSSIKMSVSGSFLSPQNNNSKTPSAVPDSVQIDQISSEFAPCAASKVSHKKETEIGFNKRKLSLCRSEFLPKVNLETVFALESEKDLLHDNANEDVFPDDFYDGIDLDAVEAQATLLLKQKSNLTTQTQSCQRNVNNVGSPSFDLGI